MPLKKTKISETKSQVVRMFTAGELSYVVAQHAANEPAFLTRYGQGAHNLNVQFSVEDGELTGAKVVLKTTTTRVVPTEEADKAEEEEEAPIDAEFVERTVKKKDEPTQENPPNADDG